MLGWVYKVWWGVYFSLRVKLNFYHFTHVCKKITEFGFNYCFNRLLVMLYYFINIMCLRIQRRWHSPLTNVIFIDSIILITINKYISIYSIYRHYCYVAITFICFCKSCFDILSKFIYFLVCVWEMYDLFHRSPYFVLLRVTWCRDPSGINNIDSLRKHNIPVLTSDVALNCKPILWVIREFC